MVRTNFKWKLVVIGIFSIPVFIIYTVLLPNASQDMSKLKQTREVKPKLSVIPSHYVNITRHSDNSMFKEVQPEKYLNDSDFKLRPNLVNRFDFEFPINGEDICSKETQPFLLIFIPSVDKDVATRKAIRETWLDATYKNLWPDAEITHTVKHFFFIGHDQNKTTSKTYKALLGESQSYGDIVVGDFHDSYRNLSLKSVLSLKWTVDYCPGAKHLLKVDQDTFINAPVMLYTIADVAAHANTSRFVLGFRHVYNWPIVVRQGRWKVSREEYAPNSFPLYMYGHAYVLGQVAVAHMYITAQRTTLIAPEDALLTGIMAKMSHTKRFYSRSFTVCCRKTYDCEVVQNRRAAMTSVNTPERMYALWERMLSHNCSDTVTWPQVLS